MKQFAVWKLPKSYSFLLESGIFLSHTQTHTHPTATAAELKKGYDGTFVMLRKLIAAQLVKKLSFYGAMWFIAKFRRPYYHTTPYINLMNPVYTLLSCFFKISFNMILLSTPRSLLLRFVTEILHSFSSTLCMLHFSTVAPFVGHPKAEEHFTFLSTLFSKSFSRHPPILSLSLWTLCSSWIFVPKLAPSVFVAG
jgi:hypothetical protein